MVVGIYFIWLGNWREKLGKNVVNIIKLNVLVVLMIGRNLRVYEFY